MTQRYIHFSNLSDATAKLGQQIGTVAFEFFRVREGYSIFKVRLAGSCNYVGTIYEGPDYLMFIGSFKPTT